MFAYSCLFCDSLEAVFLFVINIFEIYGKLFVFDSFK